MSVLQGNLKEMVRGRDGNWIVSFSTRQDFSEEFDDLKDCNVSIEIKRFRKKRSLDANAFCWSLVNQIAAKLQEKEPKGNWTPEIVYKNAIRDIASACKIHKIPTGQAKEYKEDWESLGIGFQVEYFPNDGSGWTCGFFWKGSHLFDSLEMSILINSLIQEAEGLGIPTISDEEAAKLAGAWKKGGK